MRIKGVVYWKKGKINGGGIVREFVLFWGGLFDLFCFFGGKLTSPQHMPTMRNPITQRHIGGEGGGVVGEESGSIFVDMDE